MKTLTIAVAGLEAEASGTRLKFANTIKTDWTGIERALIA
jgi:hypothetical protein